MPLINGRLVNKETIDQLRAMTDEQVIAFRNAHTGHYRGLVDAADMELARRKVQS